MGQFKTYTGNGWVDIVTGIFDSEDFEHNNLSGNYGGDTGAFSIQTGTVSEGTYALFGNGGGSSKAIIRDTTQEAWGPSVQGDLKITLRRWFDTSSNTGSGGIVFAAQSVTGYSSLNGYWLYTNANNDKITIRRVDNGSVTGLVSNKNVGLTTGSWVDETILWKTDGTIERTTDGTTISTTDTNYTSGFLGFASYRDDYFDNIQIELI